MVNHLNIFLSIVLGMHLMMAQKSDTLKFFKEYSANCKSIKGQYCAPDLVPDSKTAVLIAEAVCRQICRKDFRKFKLCAIMLANDSIWEIKGRCRVKQCKAPTILINKRNGTILQFQYVE